MILVMHIRNFDQRVDVLPSQTLFSPATRLGFGFNRSIKPDIPHARGGNSTTPLCKIALPCTASITPSSHQVKSCSGQQKARRFEQRSLLAWHQQCNGAATRGAVRLYDMLDRLRNEGRGRIFPRR